MAARAARGCRALALGLAVLACSCAARAPRSGDEETAGLPLSAPSTERILSELRARESALADFRGQARLVYEGPQGSAKSSQMIVVESPDRVRIDVMSPFGPTYTVAAYGDRLRAYDRGEKILYVGSATPANLRRYTRVPLEVEVLALLIRGLPPLTSRVARGRVEAQGPVWVWAADVEDGGQLRVEFDRRNLRPLRASLTGASPGESLFVEFEQYQDVDGVEVPHRIRARLADGGVVELEYSRIWRAVQLTATAFQIDPPSGVRVLGMDPEGTNGGAF